MPLRVPEVVQHKVDKVAGAARMERTARMKEATRKADTRRLRWDAPSSDAIVPELKGATKASEDVVAEDGLDGEFMEDVLPVNPVKRRSARF